MGMDKLAFRAHGLAQRGRAWHGRGRSGRTGTAWANGNLKQPNAAQRHKNAQELIDLEKAVVLAQPHRKGDLSQHLESPLGRLDDRSCGPRSVAVSLLLFLASLKYRKISLFADE